MKSLPIVLLGLLAYSSSLSAREGATTQLIHQIQEGQGEKQQVEQEMLQAAQSLLATLTDEQKAKAVYAFDDEERENWHFVPLNNRKGINIHELAPEQRHLAYALFGTAMSHQGFTTANQIMYLEKHLAVLENNPTRRDPEKFFTTIFGEPKAGGTWGWRFEGHHVCINITIVEGKLQGTPLFFGSNPAEMREGPLKGLRPLGKVEDAGRALAKKLTDGGHPVVISETVPSDILTGQDRVAEQLPQEGVSSAKLSKEEQDQLINIFITTYSYQRGALHEDELAKLLTTDRDQIHFAWAGSTELGAPHYFRVQSPDLLIEYVNIQDQSNHCHLTVRQPRNDFGREFLK